MIANLTRQAFGSQEARTHNICYPSSVAAVVLGGQLSTQAAFQLDRKSPLHVVSNLFVTHGDSTIL